MAYKSVTDMRAAVGAIAREIEMFGGAIEELRRAAEQGGSPHLANELLALVQELSQEVERLRRM